jgi:hypothetical protein
METINCTSCNFTNNLSDDTCKQCGESLALAKINRSVEELKKTTAKMRELTTPRKSFYTFNGCGTTLLDYRALADGTFQATRWVTVFGLPVIPLSAYVIEPESQERSYGQETSKFTIVGQTPISIARVLRTYGIVVIGLAPIIAGSLNSSFLNRRLGGPMAFFAMLLAIVWGVYFIFFRLKNDSKAYKQKAS